MNAATAQITCCGFAGIDRAPSFCASWVLARQAPNQMNSRTTRQCDCADAKTWKNTIFDNDKIV